MTGAKLPLAIAIYFGNCSRVQFDDDARQVIARAIRHRRGSLGLSQEETAARSAGMLSTANLRVFEGAGRSTYRQRSLIGVARALDWPDDAVELIAAGTDPTTLAPAVTGSPVTAVSDAAIDGLRIELEAQGRALAEIGRVVARLAAGSGIETGEWQSDVLRASHTGERSDAGSAGPRTPSRPRIEAFDPEPQT